MCLQGQTHLIRRAPLRAARSANNGTAAAEFMSSQADVRGRFLNKLRLELSAVGAAYQNPAFPRCLSAHLPKPPLWEAPIDHLPLSK